MVAEASSTTVASAGIPRGLRRLWWALAAFNLLLLLLATPFDARQQSLMAHFKDLGPGPHFWEAYAWFMERSVFDDGVLGGSDLGVLWVLAMLVVWLGLLINPRLRRGPETPTVVRLRALRRYAGFTVTVGIVCGVVVVHGLKTITGRVRPRGVFESPELFSAWYEPGANFLAGASSSFPSGHTGAAMLLFTIPVGLASRWPRAAWLGTFLVLGYAWAMALGRCLSAHHWFTDTLGSILIYLVLVPLIARAFAPAAPRNAALHD